jgi:hypothetical protein
MLVLEPVMRQLLGGGQASLSLPQRDCLVRCLERLRQHAGEALRREIAQVLQDIGTGDFLRQLNTHRQPGP